MMTANDRTVTKSFASEFCRKSENAQANFIESIMQISGCTMSEAEKVLRVYKKERIVKYDGYMGTYHVKHGAFLDAEIIQNAINL